MGFTNQIKVTANLLNCRLQPSMSAKIVNIIKMDEVHNVVAEQNGWGQLENGSWINLKFTVPYVSAEIPSVFVTGMRVGGEVFPHEDTITTSSFAPAENLMDIAYNLRKKSRDYSSNREAGV